MKKRLSRKIIKIKEGDIVYTSGVDGIIPQAIPIGKIIEKDENLFVEFFVDFNSLIGPSPSFIDVDEDGAGESIQDSQQNIRISTAPTNPSSYITRIDDEANALNNNKTLEAMRNRLNQYLGDVDNVVEEIQDERPEYENKSEGFLKIRKPNQAIIIRDISGGELEFQKNNSFLTDGFTITQWVRFVGKTGRGTLFSFGNPYNQIRPDRYGFRLETLTTLDDQDIHRRMVRLVVWDHLEEKLYDSNVPVGDRDRYDTVSNDAVAYRQDSTDSYFWDHVLIPTDDLNEWYFVCATYDPTIDEEGSFEYADENDLLKHKQFWLGHVDITPLPALTATGQILNDTQLQLDPDVSPAENPIGSDITVTVSSGTQQTYIIENFSSDVSGDVITVSDGTTPFGGLSSGTAGTVIINFNISTTNYVPYSGLGARCKVEVISRSELLRARGYKVDKFDIPLE